MLRKRLLDLALVGATLPVYIPVTAALAAAVRIADGRPVFFLQERVGQGGQTFRVWKLRTMTTEADPAARVPTRLGAWMRTRGLDELPQLWNVVRGDMSLVGPRPLTPADFERLRRDHPAFGERLRVRPGITGLAQSTAARGAAAVAAADQEYANGASARLDLEILLRTTWINVVGKRAGTWRRRGP